MGFHPAQPLLLLTDRLLDLRPSQAQHRPHVLHGRVLGELLPDLLEREADVAEGDDPMQAAQLAGRVVAVPRRRIDPVRAEQGELVVVAKHARRHLAEPGEVSDVDHDNPPDTP